MCVNRCPQRTALNLGERKGGNSGGMSSNEEKKVAGIFSAAGGGGKSLRKRNLSCQQCLLWIEERKGKGTKGRLGKREKICSNAAPATEKGSGGRKRRRPWLDHTWEGEISFID